MPILHAQVTGQAKTANGKTTNLPAPMGLILRGPVIEANVTIEPNAAKGLLAQGKPLPKPKTGLVLIDTGASGTCIDDEAAQELGLPVIDVAWLTSATHQDQECKIYPVQIIIPTVVLNCPRAMGAALRAQGLIALIGRDILGNCNLFYNGPAGQFTLSL